MLWWQYNSFLVGENRYNLFCLFVLLTLLTLLLTLPMLLYVVCVDRCGFCKEISNEHCYHWEVGDEDSIKVFCQKLEEHITQYASCNGTHFTEVKKIVRYCMNRRMN
jgi:hypothetical protein